MRFVALVLRELLEGLGVIILVGVLLTLLNSIIFFRSPDPSKDWKLHGLGKHVSSYELVQHPKPLAALGPGMLFASVILGLALGVQQFEEHEKRKTWAFTIHRSVTRSTILLAKFTAAVVAFIVCIGLLWTLLYLCLLIPGVFAYPPIARTFIEGWIFILLGFVIYLGTALSVVNTRRKYTTKYFGIPFAAAICILSMLQTSLSLNFAIIVIGLLMLLFDIVETFLSREF